ncbi:hypothetical protein KGP36_06780 [Patescibacteria group bacterium]|nr:hypothetical protein [Patescibacteria group bacterium]
MSFVVFEKGLFLGFFDDPVKASDLTDGRKDKGPHSIVEYVPVDSCEAEITRLRAELEGARKNINQKVRKEYISRLIAGVRRERDSDPDTMRAKEECGEEVRISRWIDASILCLVIEEEVLGIAREKGEHDS